MSLYVRLWQALLPILPQTPARAEHANNPMLPLLVTLLILIAVGVYIRAEYAGQRHVAYVFKPLSTLLIMAFCALQTPAVSPTYAVLILIGLACSLAGDVFLMLPTDQFMAGLISFLIAHVFYIIAFTSQGGFGLTLPFIGIVLLVAGLVLQVILPHAGRLAGPVVAYMLGILLMLWQALEYWHSAPNLGTTLAVTGAALFVFSDFTLAQNRFVAPFRSARFLNLTTYFAAQWCLALSVRQF